MNRYRTDVVLFAALFAFWLLLSGRWDPIFVVLGVISAAAVTGMCGPIVRRAYADPLVEGDPATGPGPLRSPVAAVRAVWWFVAYLGWLMWRVVIANVQVAYVVCHPRLPIEPRILRFKTRLRSHVARATLANSITLTPSTITVDFEDGEYVIHTLFPSAADLVLNGEMQRRIARFALEDDEPYDIVWEPTPGIGR